MTATQDVQHVLAVYLGTAMFGIPITHIQEVLETPPLTYVPMLPPEVRGVMNLRGRVVTAIDLWAGLRQQDKSGVVSAPAFMSVVIEEDGDLYSLLVDKVGDVYAIPAASIAVVPPTVNESLRKVSSGVFQLKDQIIIILKPDMLLGGDADIN